MAGGTEHPASQPQQLLHAPCTDAILNARASFPPCLFSASLASLGCPLPTLSPGPFLSFGTISRSPGSSLRLECLLHSTGGRTRSPSQLYTISSSFFVAWMFVYDLLFLPLFVFCVHTQVSYNFCAFLRTLFSFLF